ncbi:hypothetical protein CFBP7900_30210 [Xanthomonas hortorum pv. carotae]|uniref:Uncharacterized protein n=1 Tax=Xanthomonas hortorum pv. carotae TaxID=487904 RepID=A0A6V7F4N1_9XANT|nr:hypothetical protein XHC_1533 [Xanthomonas hortorum pv. carotae str. M081]CAD0358415.1 hypothetical protein CFBP7900_30210 [Xanthomonas hortorum pv. carotae]CAD0358421.1 hypothetical protein CFBP7900_30210 [Xanthomonas hortorum pv. carotae]
MTVPRQAMRRRGALSKGLDAPAGEKVYAALEEKEFA